LYWKGRGSTDIFDGDFLIAAKEIVSLWKTEQNHTEKSPYTFVRQGCPPEDKDTLPNKGYGNPVAYTGMTWSGFRPSDDSCIYGYLVPSNMFAVVVLGYLEEILKSFYADETDFISECQKLRAEIDSGIKKYAVYNHPKYGEIFACEADGFGNVRLFDDANVPSLLSIPYIGYASKDDEMYLRTRNFILSTDNPYYYKGKFAKGVGSPHTPEGYIWHIALSMQALTSNDDDEIREIINTLVSTDADTGYMHEGFNADNPAEFSREWFAWSNSLFAELIEQAVDKGII
ncbi:MAG: glycoside hydrolase family 125 protein, partial [Acutalibacteraceae bacterium]